MRWKHGGLRRCRGARALVHGHTRLWPLARCKRIATICNPIRTMPLAQGRFRLIKVEASFSSLPIRARAHTSSPSIIPPPPDLDATTPRPTTRTPLPPPRRDAFCSRLCTCFAHASYSSRTSSLKDSCRSSTPLLLLGDACPRVFEHHHHCRHHRGIDSLVLIADDQEDRHRRFPGSPRPSPFQVSKHCCCTSLRVRLPGTLYGLEVVLLTPPSPPYSAVASRRIVCASPRNLPTRFSSPPIVPTSAHSPNAMAVPTHALLLAVALVWLAWLYNRSSELPPPRFESLGHSSSPAMTVPIPSLDFPPPPPIPQAKGDNVELKVPPTEDRPHRYIVLPNGLEVILVSDPKSDKAAASMDVGVGHLSDPDDLPGCAHFW